MQVLCCSNDDLGRRQVVKCLVDVRRLFIATGDQRYVLNDLYIDDYCSWTQHIRLTLGGLHSSAAETRLYH